MNVAVGLVRGSTAGRGAVAASAATFTAVTTKEVRRLDFLRDASKKRLLGRCLSHRPKGAFAMAMIAGSIRHIAQGAPGRAIPRVAVQLIACRDCHGCFGCFCLFVLLGLEGSLEESFCERKKKK